MQPAVASAAGSIQSGFFQFAQTPPPLSVTWQFGTSTGESVSATWSGLQPSPTNQLSVTPENAAAFGIDFAAWAQAVTDPDYSRSIVTVNGVSQEGTVLRFGDVQELDLLHFNVVDYRWPVEPGLPNFGVSVSAVDRPIVPEPATWLLMICFTTLNLFISRRL
jgi:hypothetical protein